MDEPFVEKELDPFEIVHHARSRKSSRSRKTSMNTMDRERKDKEKNSKRLRKMTLNPETFIFQEELTSIKEQNEAKVRS